MIRVAALLAAAALTAGCGEVAAQQAAPPVTVTPATGPVATTSSAASVYRGQKVPGAPVATDFALRDQNGKLIQLSAQRGHDVLLTFLYTSCPDICPVIADTINDAAQSLGPKSGGVRIIAVTVDPEHDTPAAVDTFIAEHRLAPNFHYLTGPVEELKPIWQAYNLLIEPGASDRVNHSAWVLLIDRDGRSRMLYPPLTEEATILHDLRVMALLRR